MNNIYIEAIKKAIAIAKESRQLMINARKQHYIDQAAQQSQKKAA